MGKKIDVSKYAKDRRAQDVVNQRLQDIAIALQESERRAIASGTESPESERLSVELVRCNARHAALQVDLPLELDALIGASLDAARAELGELDENLKKSQSDLEKSEAALAAELERVRLKHAPGIEKFSTQIAELSSRHHAIRQCEAELLFESLTAAGIEFDRKQLTQRCWELRTERETQETMERAEKQAAQEQAESEKPGFISRLSAFLAPAPAAGMGAHVGGVERL